MFNSYYIFLTIGIIALFALVFISVNLKRNLYVEELHLRTMNTINKALGNGISLDIITEYIYLIAQYDLDSIEIRDFRRKHDFKLCFENFIKDINSITRDLRIVGIETKRKENDTTRN